MPKRFTSNRIALVLATALATIVARSPAEAQLLRRENFTLSTGIVYYRTGAPRNSCPEAGGLSAGFDFQTRGAWNAGAGIALFLATTGPCGGVGIIVHHNGEELDEKASLQLLGAPAIEVHGGRSLARGDLDLSLSAVARLTYGTLDYGAGKGSFAPWLGARLTLDGIAGRLGAGFELGTHRAPVHWIRSDQSVAHSFGRWEPLGQLTLRFRPWSDSADAGG